MIDQFLKFTDRTGKLTEGIAVVLLFGFCLLMLAEVLSRALLRTSLAVSWEYSAFAMGAVFTFGFGPALAHGTHVRVALLLEQGGPNFRRAVDMAATGVALILSALMVVAFATLFSTSLMRGIREASYMATPLAVPQAFAVIGSIQFSLALTARLIRLALRLPAETEPADPDAIHHA